MAMPYQLPTYTVDAVRRLPRDGMRYELLDGVLLVTPQPGFGHQLVVSGLLVALHDALTPSGKARVVGPGEIEIAPRHLLQPDILVVPASYPPTVQWRDIRAWWLAVEVTSRSTRVYDRDYKVDAYLTFGVDEVWLVRPARREVRRWNQRGVADEPCRDVIRWKPMGRQPMVEIPLDQIFQDL